MATTTELPALDPLDLLAIDALLDDEERAIRDTVRQFVRDNVLPDVGDWFEKGVLPQELMAELGKLGLYGMHLDGYGLPGASAVAYGLTCLELDAGSDPGAMRTHARRDGSDWILNGAKMWITNGTIADIAIVWARTDEGAIRGFIVEKGMAGFSAPEIHKKLSLRASVTSELVLQDVRVPDESLLPGASSLRGPLSCLNEARFGIVFGSIGAARACFECALDYAKERIVFGQP